MISAGLDIGARAVKAVVLREGAVAGRALELTGFDAPRAARAALDAALSAAGVARSRPAAVVATGVGRELAPDGARGIAESEALARGALALVPGARTVVEVGAEDARVLRCDERGRVIELAVAEPCAAGAGIFTETIARILDLPLEQLGPLSCTSERPLAIAAQCVVFAEREVVELVHANVPRADIVRAVHDAIAARTASLAQQVGCCAPVVLVGGLARDVGFVEACKRGLRLAALEVPEHPELCAALGAALVAADAA